MMTSDQFGGVLRAVLSALGGWMVSKGMVDNTTMMSVAGALCAVGVMVWSHRVHA